MRPSCFCLLVFLAISPLTLQARSLPLTVNEVSLMLRSGYNSETIKQDLSKRHFGDTIDAKTESQLFKAGASVELVADLKNGKYSISAEEAAQAKEEMAMQAQRRAQQAEESRKFNTLYQDQLARDRAAAMKSFQASNITYDYLKGSLVRVTPNGLMRADDEAIGRKKLIAYYFSAHWCAPCRKFTPQLVDYYNRVASEHPEFEIVFFSMDKSATDMEQYMRTSNMPWPAIAYDKLKEKELLSKAAGSGIPSLVLVDSSSKLLSRSFDGAKYLGPEKVLADLDAIFAGKQPGPIAAR